MTSQWQIVAPNIWVTRASTVCSAIWRCILKYADKLCPLKRTTKASPDPAEFMRVVKRQIRDVVYSWKHNFSDSPIVWLIGWPDFVLNGFSQSSWSAA